MMRPIERVRRWWQSGEHAPAPPDPSAGAGGGNGANGAAHPTDNGDKGGKASPELPQPPPANLPREAKESSRREPPWLGQLDRAGIPRSLVYPSTTLGRILDQSADRFADATALVYVDLRWTYRELLSQVNRTAGALASLGVRRGDRVLMTLPNCPEFVTVFFAAQKLGAVVVNAGPLMGADDLRTVMSMTTPRAAVGLDLQAATLCEAGRRSTVEHWVWVSLQGYQSMFKRLGYQFKLWQSHGPHPNDAAHPPGNAGHGPCEAQHASLAHLLERAPARPPSVEPDPRRTAVLQATGGTTGTLKLAELTHRGLLANATQASVWMGCRMGQERILAILPMFHVYGLTTCLVTGIYSASTLILATRFIVDETLDLARKHRPTIFPLVPAICDALSDRIEKEQEKERNHKNGKNGKDGRSGNHGPGHRIEELRVCMSGAAPLPVASAERFNRLTGGTVIEGYGLTEASPVTHCNLVGRAKAGSIGLPLPDTRVRIADLDDPTRDVPVGEPGEMLVNGPQVMGGYFANPEGTNNALVTDAHGDVWLRTGDLARCDEEGFFYVVGRKKDMIIRSGMKVYPGKVEKVLLTHPKVADAAVVGRPCPVHTETVVAVVVLSGVSGGAPEPGQLRQLTDELRSLCREHLAPYEVPQVIEFTDKLPRNALGKLLKRELRKGPAGPQACEPPIREVMADPPGGRAGGNGHHPSANGEATANRNGQSNGVTGTPAGKEPRS